MTTSAPLHVLVVDDSAVVRHTVTRLLGAEDGWRLTAAPDPVVGLERIRVESPDVILLDLEMPRMDGLTFLRHLMATEPIPVVICSGYAEHGTRLALAALDAGAVEIFPKPRLGVKEFLERSGPSLTSVLRRAASAAPSLRRGWRPDPGTDRALRPAPDGSPSAARVQDSAVPDRPRTASAEPTAVQGPWSRTVLLGASMGGPDAIRSILTRFPADAPPCLVVQHMPERFTTTFARRLDEMVLPEVREAESGDPVLPGQVLVAPGGRHLVVESRSRGPVVQIVDSAPVHDHRPSVDVLFESAATVLGSAVVAAVLTGMGEDGAGGLEALARAGARTLVQDRASSVVWGMPGAALTRHAGHRSVPLRRLGEVVLELARKAPKGPAASASGGSS